jgi:hypothetical protein
MNGKCTTNARKIVSMMRCWHYGGLSKSDQDIFDFCQQEEGAKTSGAALAAQHHASD